MPFSQGIKAGAEPATYRSRIELCLIPEPEAELKAKYLATLASDQERATAKKVIEEYIQPRLLTLPGQVTLRCRAGDKVQRPKDARCAEDMPTVKNRRRFLQGIVIGATIPGRGPDQLWRAAGTGAGCESPSHHRESLSQFQQV